MTGASPAGPRARRRAAGALLFAALLILGVGLRLRYLDDGALFIDEAESSINALTILEHGYPSDTYMGLPMYENTLTHPWPESREYEFRDSSYSTRGMAIYHGWLPLYAIAASMLAGSHLVYAGDPQQLPPIVQAEGKAAARWFGRNVYDWFGVTVDGDVAATRLSLLRTQYRMTDEIGGVVSRLSYGSLLRHGRGATGPMVEFIDVGADWETAHYSVPEASYYHLAAVPVLHALADILGAGADEFSAACSSAGGRPARPWWSAAGSRRVRRAGTGSEAGDLHGPG